MTSSTQTVAALASMFFGAKLKGTIEQAGYTYLGAIGVSGLLKHARERSPIAIFLDLGKDDIDFASLVSELRNDQLTSSIPIVAFCGHVETDKLNAAREWGCDVVTSNGMVTASFETILQKALDR